MRFEERAVAFDCGADRLYGVATVPAAPSRRGVLVVVGGPQYRAGSHRQFVLLARRLAEAGIAAMRFDYRGMGDSEGAPRDFEAIGDDLRAATDHFLATVPEVQEVVLWGLCDGASAALCHAAQDPRIGGLVLLNPWARTEESIAKTTLKHYYRKRLLEAGLWRKILQGRFDIAGAARSLAALVRTALRPGPAPASTPATHATTLPQRMCAGLEQFGGRVLFIIGGADLTGREFCDMAASSPNWRRLLAAPRVTQRELPAADHTFSRRDWHDQMTLWTCDWVRAW
jgi:exosortase A-associated hydrolase 1